ncbi:MAG: DUF2975 domain-containing protein [Marinoscillum sp.]
MRKLGLIYSFLNFVSGLVIIGTIIAVFFITTLPNGTFIDIGNPYFRVVHVGEESIHTQLNDAINDVLWRHTHNTEPLVFDLKRVDISTEISTSWKILIITYALLTGGFFLIILLGIQRILNDIRNGKPFGDNNIKRIWMIGILIAFAPLAEWLMHMITIYWFQPLDRVDGLNLEFSSRLGWEIFIIGLLIYTLGYAFEQGKKMEEEQALTI